MEQRAVGRGDSGAADGLLEGCTTAAAASCTPLLLTGSLPGMPVGIGFTKLEV